VFGNIYLLAAAMCSTLTIVTWGFECTAQFTWRVCTVDG